jgi:cytoskeleton protein RodZ
MTSEAGGEPARGIGARLRAAREKRGLTVLQAAEKLHVDARTLEALEGEDFAALGADVYVRGHLRRYAEALGESPAELQALYAGSTHAVRPDLTRIPRPDVGNRSARLLLPALLLVVGFAVAGLLWWVFTLPGEKAQPVPIASPLPAASAAGGADAGAAQAVPADTGASAAAALAAAGATVRPGPAVGSAPAGAAAPGQLNLRFAAACWVEVSDAGGRRLLGGLIEAGSTRALSGTTPLHVVLGNAAAVELRLNGQPVSLSGLVRHDGSAHLLIDAAGRASAEAPRLAHGD